MTFTDRMTLKQSFEDATTTPTNGDFPPLPDNTYQITLTKIHLVEAKKGKYEGKLRVDFHGKVLTGEFKGRTVWRGVNLEMQADGARPSGVSMLKGDLATLGANLESRENESFEDTLTRIFKTLIGTNVEIASVTKTTVDKQWTNIYFNQLIGDIQLKSADLEPTEAMDDIFAEDTTEAMDTAPEATTTTTTNKKKRGRPKGSKNHKKPELVTTPAATNDSEFGDEWDED